MRRILPILYALVTLLSLAVLVATAVLWVRSTGQGDRWSGEAWRFDSSAGRLRVTNFPGLARYYGRRMRESPGYRPGYGNGDDPHAPGLVDLTLEYRWIELVACVVPIAWVGTSLWGRRRGVRRSSLCRVCGYDLRATHPIGAPSAGLFRPRKPRGPAGREGEGRS